MDPAAQYFFHYTTREAAFEHILPARQLRLSPYESMRDPLENKRWAFPASWFSTTADDPAEINDRAERTWMEFHAHANEIRLSAKLLALTIDAHPDEQDEEIEECFTRGWSRARMWEQYAEAHAGVCLVFSRDALTEAIVTSLVDQDVAPPYHGAVDYSSAGFRRSRLSLDMNDLSRDYSVGVARKWVEDHHDALFFKKTLTGAPSTSTASL